MQVAQTTERAACPVGVGLPPISFRVHEIRTGSAAGARHDFEDMVVQLVRVSHPGVRTVEAQPGDWGIDAFVGEIVDEITVWQAKYFIDGVGDSQKAQIRDSFASAMKAASDHGHALRRWVLCIPTSMDGSGTKWWDRWKSRQTKSTGVEIVLWDGTELTGLLNSLDAVAVRRAFYDAYGSALRPSDREIAPVADPSTLESALFVRQLTEAGHAEIEGAKLQFFNADLMAREITDKGVDQELRALTVADATVHGLWETRFNELCEAVAGRQLPGLHARVMEDVRGERTNLGPPLRATLVHLCGMVHRVVEDNRAGWVRDWRQVAVSHVAVSAGTSNCHTHLTQDESPPATTTVDGRR